MIVCGLDLESTGVDVTKDRIVELAMVTQELETGDTKISFSRRFNPEMHIAAKATAVHGIADADVFGEPLFSRSAPVIGKMLERVDLLVMHNGIDFDGPLLMNEFGRCGVTLTRSPKMFDTMRAGVWATPDGKFPRLGELCYALGIDYDSEKAHAALYDTNVMLQAFRKGYECGLWNFS